MSGPQGPSFSVVIPTYQRRDLVCAAVAAAAAIEYDGPFEVIVVVDGSTDGTVAALRQLDLPVPLRIVEQPNRGAAAARNAGAAEACGEILLFLDDDMICRSDILTAHARNHAAGADAVLGDIPLDPASPPGHLSRAVGRWAARRREELCAGRALRPDDILTGQISVRRTVFDELGGFDGRFTAEGSFGNEDIDFGLRLLERHRIAFEPDAISWQRYSVTPRHYLRQWRDAGRADVVLARKYAARGASVLTEFQPSPATRLLAHVPALTSAISATAPFLASAFPGEGRIGRAAGRLLSLARDLAYRRGRREASLRQSKLLVLCYHAVADLSDDPLLAPYGCPQEQFERQLDQLKRRGFSFIGPDDFLAAADGTAALPGKAVLLTFDDCYAELPRIAEDVLAPRGIPAIAFAVAGLVGKSNEWDQSGGGRKLSLADISGLQAMNSCGVEIGCHSMTHAYLCGLPPAALAHETEGAAATLASLGLSRPRFFAYPYGESDARSRAAVASAGYRAAFVLTDRRADPAGDPLRVPRVEIFARDRGLRFRLRTWRPGIGQRLPGASIAGRARRWIARKVMRAR